MVDARGLLHTLSRRVHFHAGVFFHAQIARGEKQNFPIYAGRGCVRRIADDDESGARLCPACEVIEIRVLPVGHEIELRFFCREENGDAAMQLSRERHAPGMEHVGRLFRESVQPG